MRRSNLMFLLIGAAIIFSGCSNDDTLVRDLSQGDQVTSSLKSSEVKRTFEGICNFVAPVPNTWYDATDDWRVTGTTVWVQPDPDKFEGTAELFVDAKNPHDENRGKWEMMWTGDLNFIEGGVVLVATVTGVGVEGKVKGMEANWIYTMDYVGADFPNPANPTFFYVIEGNIEKPQGPIKKD